MSAKKNDKADPILYPKSGRPDALRGSRTTDREGHAHKKKRQGDPILYPKSGRPDALPQLRNTLSSHFATQTHEACMQEKKNTQEHHTTQNDPSNSEEPIPDTLRMIAPEEVARATLHGVAGDLGRDEVRVLTRIAERLQAGRLTYGPLFLANDTRTFRSKEAREELEDALVYLACAWLKAETQEVTG
jgi:hypothetical protein